MFTSNVRSIRPHRAWRTFKSACKHQHQIPKFSSTAATTSANATQQTQRSFFLQHKGKIMLSALLGTSTLLYLTNDEVHYSAKFLAHAFGRIRSVTVATIRCFIKYKQTLSATYETKEEYYAALSKCHLESANITLGALEKNRGIYIKLGQHISAMTYLLPIEWTETMTVLQDQCPKSDIEEINAMFIKDWGKPIDELFDDFEPKPIGVASLAQVHIAKLKETGEKVAVKCQHPSLTEFVPLDVAMTAFIFRALDAVFPEYPMTWLSDELRDSIFVELDFRNEARNSQNTKDYFENFENITALRIPTVVKATKRILVMEYLKGERLDNLKYLEGQHIDRSQVSSCLSHIFNNMIFTPGAGIHCDPHGGNLAIRAHKPTHSNPFNFEIILYDHGLYRQLTNEMRYDYAQFWLSMISNNQEKMKEYAIKFAGIKEEQFPLFAAAITGRDVTNALNFNIESQRSDDEVKNMKDKITNEEILTDLMSILSQVPRVVLLILKTNDLTRHLDEVLQNPLGLKRTFLILSNYCANTIYSIDQQRTARDPNWLTRWLGYLGNWCEWKWRVSQLFWYDLVVYWKRVAGVE